MPTNADVEAELAREIPEILKRFRLVAKPYQCEVRLYRGDRKKQNSAEFEWNWDPENDSISIRVWPAAEHDEHISATANPATSGVIETGSQRLNDLVSALDRAERRPGYDFVSLKWFRDAALSHESFPWVADVSVRQDVLREAIDKRWILTSKIANPRPPHFPVTAIRLNRQMPEVSALLGSAVETPGAFQPLPIRGETLSASVLAARR